jgi:hypothetical protein
MIVMFYGKNITHPASREKPEMFEQNILMTGYRIPVLNKR